MLSDRVEGCQMADVYCPCYRGETLGSPSSVSPPPQKPDAKTSPQPTSSRQALIGRVGLPFDKAEQMSGHVKHKNGRMTGEQGSDCNKPDLHFVLSRFGDGVFESFEHMGNSFGQLL